MRGDLKRSERRIAPNERGIALIGVVVLVVLLMAFAATFAVAVRSDTQMRGVFASSITGFYAAESGLNRGMGEYRNIFLDYNVPSGSDFALRTFTLGERTVSYQMTPRPSNPQQIVIPSGELFSGLNALQYRYTVNSEAENITGAIEARVGAEFLVGYIPLFQFVAFYRNDLEILPGPTMNLMGRVHTNGDLYMNANNQLNIVDNPPVGVFTVQVSAGGDIHRGRKDTSDCRGAVNIDKLEDVVAPFGDLDPKSLPCNGSATRQINDAELSAWQGSVINKIGNIAIPEPDIIEVGTGVFWEKAELRIALRVGAADNLPGPPVVPLPHSIEIQDSGGNRDASATFDLHAFMSDAAWNSANSSYPGTMPAFYTDVPGCDCADGVEDCSNEVVNCYLPALPGSAQRTSGGGSGAYSDIMGTGLGNFDLDYRRGGFYNHREDKWMLLLNLNIADLIQWNDDNGEPFFATADASDGGLVLFLTVDGPQSDVVNNYGVRVFGSADIALPGGIGVTADPTGVTVVSDQAMYVLGDYNRGTVGGGIPRQPSALIGDSVNVMSQRFWRGSANTGCGADCCTGDFCRDGQSVRTLSSSRRDAETTWVNAAFLGGVDTTAVGDYNGGLENYPRFHEDWSGGRALNYQGSFVSLGEPQRVDGDWCGTGGSSTSGCNIYKPPVRNWNFDPAFGDVANLPPLTPRFVYVQQVLFTEDFR